MAVDQARAVLAAAFAALALASCGKLVERSADTRIPPGLSARFWPPHGFAWGVGMTGEGAAFRYGVAAPVARVSQGEVLIAVGETPIESWFETAGDLTARGQTVWLVEGGADSVSAMVRAVIRPAEGLVLLAHGQAAPAVLEAAGGERLPVRAIVLSSPSLQLAGSETARWMVRLGAGDARPAGRPWRRSGPDGRALRLTHDPWRGRVIKAWQSANPDLRAEGRSFIETVRTEDFVRAARKQRPAIQAPVLVLNGVEPEPEVARLCASLPRCRVRTLPGGWAHLHLEADVVRGPWLAEVQAAAITQRK